MAFNHVGNCSCPVGDCDCGVDYTHATAEREAWQMIQSLRPMDVYVLTHTGELMERQRDIKEYGTNQYAKYVGQIDPKLTVPDALEKMYALEIHLMRTNLPEVSKRKYLYDLGRFLSAAADNKKDREAIAEAINKTYEIKYSRVTTDWVGVF